MFLLFTMSLASNAEEALSSRDSLMVSDLVTQTTEVSEIESSSDLRTKVSQLSSEIVFKSFDGEAANYRYFTKSSKPVKATNSDEYKMTQAGVINIRNDVKFSGILISENLINEVSFIMDQDKSTRNKSLQSIIELLSTQDDKDQEHKDFNQLLMGDGSNNSGLIKNLNVSKDKSGNKRVAYLEIEEGKFITVSDFNEFFRVDLNKSKIDLIKNITYFILSTNENNGQLNDDLYQSLCNSDCNLSNVNAGEVLLTIAAIAANNTEESKKVFCTLDKYNDVCPSKTVTKTLNNYLKKEEWTKECDENEKLIKDLDPQLNPTNPQDINGKKGTPKVKPKLDILIRRTEVNKEEKKARYLAEIVTEEKLTDDGVFKWKCKGKKSNCSEEGDEVWFEDLKRTQTYSVTVTYNNGKEIIAESEIIYPNIDCSKGDGDGCTTEQIEDDKNNPIEESSDEEREPIYGYEGAGNLAPAPFTPDILPQENFGGTFMSGSN